ncbi:MAG: IPT/TIG domain-containing protein [Candidatus Sericytochromatia bacterium]
MKQSLFMCAALALGLASAGCMQPTVPQTPAVLAAASGTVTATMHLAVQDASGRQLLDVAGMEPWKKADIDHVKLSLYKADALVVTTTVPQASLSGTVTFSNLHKDAAYKVVAEAFSDALATNRIDATETDALSCTTEFATTTVESVDAGAIKLKLKNKVFSGATTGSTIEVTDGIVESTPATETVTVVAPPPTLTSLSHHTISGGYQVTLTGTNLAEATSVTIGGETATISSKSATSILVRVPYLDGVLLEDVPVVVTTPSGTATMSVPYN